MDYIRLLLAFLIFMSWINFNEKKELQNGFIASRSDQLNMYAWGVHHS